MVARVLGIDRDDRQMRQVLALAQRHLRNAVRLVDRLLREFGAQPVLVDRDQREAARRERIAEHRVDPRRDPRRPPAHFAQHEVADLRVVQLGDRELAALFLVDRRQPEALALALDHAQRELRRLGELLQRMRDAALALLLGARQHPVADPERALAPFEHAQARRRGLGMPLLGHREDVAAVVDLADPQHGDLGHPARLVERPPARMIDQPLVGHVVEQPLQVDLVLPRQAERPRDLALARRLVGRGDEVEDLLAASAVRWGGCRIDCAEAAMVVRRVPAGEFSVFGAVEPCLALTSA